MQSRVPPPSAPSLALQHGAGCAPPTTEHQAYERVFGWCLEGYFSGGPHPDRPSPEADMFSPLILVAQFLLPLGLLGWIRSAGRGQNRYLVRNARIEGAPRS